MAINRIEKLHHPGVLRDFAWPDGLVDFGRYNLIYGWNGTGKTTISRVFRDLEIGRTPAVGDVVLNLDGRNVDGSKFRPEVHAVRVFNREFIDENVFQVTGESMPLILVLGARSVAKQQTIDARRRSLALANEQVDEASAKLDRAKRALEQHSTDRAKAIKELLRARGGTSYDNYHRGNYESAARTLLDDPGAAAPPLTQTALVEARTLHTTLPREPLEEISFQLPTPAAEEGIVNELLARTVISEVIEELKDDAETSSWVREGLRLHEQHDSLDCLFCKQRLPMGRLSALKRHFNEGFTLLQADLRRTITRLESARDAGSTVRLHDRARFHEGLAADWDRASAVFRQAVQSSNSVLEAHVDALTQKQAQPFVPIAPVASGSGVDSASVLAMNEIIQRHNEICANHDSIVVNARRDLELHYISESLGEFVELNTLIDSTAVELGARTSKRAGIESEIERLEQEIDDYRRPAEALNEELRGYLGHDELQLSVEGAGYGITRNGQRADHLSEGERTAIALLYFLQSLKDRRFLSTQGVVVLDDPVSSLDAQALYLAFAFIKERTKKVAQLFIFTHNWSLFRLVRRWFGELNQWKKKAQESEAARFYMLECDVEKDPRTSTLKPLDRLLRDHESEYQYLFSRVREAAHRDGDAGLSAYYVLPNVARRLMEAFLGFRYPDSRGDLPDLLQRADFDPVAKMQMQRFMNAQSHIPTMGGQEEDPSVLGTTRVVLRSVLELMKAEDPDHYRGMVKTVSQATGS